MNASPSTARPGPLNWYAELTTSVVVAMSQEYPAASSGPISAVNWGSVSYAIDLYRD